MSDMNDPIPIPNVSSKIMSKIVAYCKRHSEHDEAKKAAEGGGAGASGAGGATASSAAAAPAAVSDDDLKDFDAEFVKVDQSTLFEMILAANYLDVKVREIKEGFFVFFVSDFFLLFSSSSLYRLLTSGGEKTKKRNKNLPKPLLNLTCLTVANMIKGKTPEEIRKTFNIPNDFTPEEEEEVRRENQWAFGAFFSCVLSCSFFCTSFPFFSQPLVAPFPSRNSPFSPPFSPQIPLIHRMSPIGAAGGKGKDKGESRKSGFGLRELKKLFRARPVCCSLFFVFFFVVFVCSFALFLLTLILCFFV